MTDIKTLALQCRDASQVLARLSSAARRDLLASMADALDADAGAILAANERDLQAARDKGVGAAMLDRLALNPQPASPTRCARWPRCPIRSAR